jgi:hypothetical protein
MPTAGMHARSPITDGLLLYHLNAYVREPVVQFCARAGRR